jgi:hypothetical protein
MATFSLKNFQTQIRTSGLAKPSRFEVIITPPPILTAGGFTQDSKLLSLFCEAASLPTQTLGVKTQKIQGPGYQRPVSVDYGGDGIPMTFILDQGMNLKALFDYWMGKIIDPKQYFVYYQNTYVAQIQINQLDNKDNIKYSVVLEDAFPRSVALLDLNHNSQNQIHKLNVTFAYRRWHPVHSKFVGNNLFPNVNDGINEYQNTNNYLNNVQQDRLYDIQTTQQPVPGRPRGGQ